MSLGTTKPDYGVDAPGVIRNLCVAGAGLFIAGFFLPRGWRLSLQWPVVIFSLEGLAMLLYAKVGKFRHRDRMLAMIDWKGTENVLDVGTGRGLLMIGAAKKLAAGRSIGIDIWNAEDLSGNGAEATAHNIALEGVAANASVQTDDARRMSFADASFDVVLSNLALHNIPNAEGRAAACREIARVLKPGGKALISDFQKTGEYLEALCAAGLSVSRTRPYFIDTFPPLRIVAASKN